MPEPMNETEYGDEQSDPTRYPTPGAETRGAARTRRGETPPPGTDRRLGNEPASECDRGEPCSSPSASLNRTRGRASDPIETSSSWALRAPCRHVPMSPCGHGVLRTTRSRRTDAE